ncbi:MAG: SRPBCC family protein [Actinomycetota bacterium]|jgi:hypothetical protein|nr:SRPBCC family protein [Actinomycetota bacterium]
MSADLWPEATVEQVVRLRAMAAGIPGSAFVEVHIPAPFELVWAVASDLERELPHFVDDVRTVQLVHGDADRAEALIRGYSGFRARFAVVLRPGWCVMQSHFVIGGMAATATEAGTRFAFLGAARLPFSRAASPVLSAVGTALAKRTTKRFERCVERRLT